jgi:phospholipid-binding lipoprotein MlaA
MRDHAMHRVLQLLLIVLVAGLAGCAGSQDMEAIQNNDPLEPFNRAVFSFNDKVDENVALPLARAYVRVFPEPIRYSIHNFVYNLELPITLANDILQVKPVRAAQTIARLAVNSTIGLVGLADAASKLGIPDHSEDFGQTLGFYGLGEGPYLVLPFLGPAPPRDLTGRIVDIFFDPITYIDLREKTWWSIGRETVDLIDTRSRNIDTVENLRKSAIDFYATTRNIYRQYRDAEIHDNSGDMEQLPNF